jgi:iron complex outermembrane recepter protein
MIKNAGESRSQGFELSLRANPAGKFETILAYGFTDARFVSHVVDTVFDYSGNLIPYVPRHTLSLQLNQGIELPQNLIIDKINLTALYRLLGKHFWDAQNNEYQKAYGLLDFRVGIQRGNASLDFWAKNLLGAEYASFYFEIPQLGNRYAQPGKPLHLGFNLALKL